MWMHYSMQSWPEAEDLESAVRRLECEFSDLAFECILARNSARQSYVFSEQDLHDREELFNRGQLVCRKYLNYNIDLIELCDLLVCITLRSFLYGLKPFLPRELVEKHKLESEDCDDSHDESKCCGCSLGPEMRDFVYFEQPLSKP